MKPTKKPYQSVILTYESAIEPIADKLYSRRVFEEGSRLFYAGGKDGIAKKLQEHADEEDTRAWALVKFVSQLFGLSSIDVRCDAYERATEMYMEAKNG